MENKSSVIASSNNPVPVLGQFLEESGAREAATNFAKNFVKNKFNKEKNNNKTEDNKNVSVIEKSQNFINKVNQTGFKADLSGVGFEKTFGNKDQGLSATVYGQQDFGKPAQYGAKLGFNYKF
jgi:CRISPR/Cas system-associated endonuclease Cas1